MVKHTITFLPEYMVISNLTGKCLKTVQNCLKTVLKLKTIDSF